LWNDRDGARHDLGYQNIVVSSLVLSIIRMNPAQNQIDAKIGNDDAQESEDAIDVEK